MASMARSTKAGATTKATATTRRIGPHGRHRDSKEAVEVAVSNGTLPRKALRLQEAAKTLGISRWHLDKLIDQGEIGTSRLGSLRVVPISEIDRVLERSFERRPL
jgi:excisionase family DNA binding protein